jgi:hypothetical protein
MSRRTGLTSEQPKEITMSKRRMGQIVAGVLLSAALASVTADLASARGSAALLDGFLD